jgi:hypothetical protein
MHRPIRCDRQICSHQLTIVPNKIGYMRTSDLLLALQEEHEVARQSSASLQVRFNPQDLR